MQKFLMVWKTLIRRCNKEWNIAHKFMLSPADIIKYVLLFSNVVNSIQQINEEGIKFIISFIKLKFYKIKLDD